MCVRWFGFTMILTVLPHDLCVAHGLIDAREGAHGLLHHLLAHAEHVVLLEELIRQLCHTQAWVNLLHSQTHTIRTLWHLDTAIISKGLWAFSLLQNAGSYFLDLDV